MKNCRLRLAAILLFCLCLILPNRLKAQRHSRGFVALPDSNWVLLTPKARKDSVLKIAKSLFALPSGSQKLKIMFLNDKRWNNWSVDTTLHIQPADTLFLKKLTTVNKIMTPFQIIPLHFTQEKSHFLKQSVKPGLATLAVLSNWTSFYLKRKADDYYRDYQRASDLKKINKFYAKTQNFDAFSNIMLGVSAASLSTFLYLMITEK